MLNSSYTTPVMPKHYSYIGILVPTHGTFTSCTEVSVCIPVSLRNHSHTENSEWIQTFLFRFPFLSFICKFFAKFLTLMFKESHKHPLIVHVILINRLWTISLPSPGSSSVSNEFCGALEERGKEQEPGYIHVKIWYMVFMSLKIPSLPPPSNCSWQQLIFKWTIGSMEASFVQEALQRLCEGQLSS